MAKHTEHRPRDEHARFIHDLLEDTDPEKTAAANRHVAGCDICKMRLKRGAQLLVDAGLAPPGSAGLQPTPDAARLRTAPHR
jgi:hypothetical protein